jgi:hypothetical protein
LGDNKIVQLPSPPEQLRFIHHVVGCADGILAVDGDGHSYKYAIKAKAWSTCEFRLPAIERLFSSASLIYFSIAKKLFCFDFCGDTVSFVCDFDDGERAWFDSVHFDMVVDNVVYITNRDGIVRFNLDEHAWESPIELTSEVAEPHDVEALDKVSERLKLNFSPFVALADRRKTVVF